MNAGTGWRSGAHPRVPTLTEVIHVPDDAPPAGGPAVPPATGQAALAEHVAAVPAANPPAPPEAAAAATPVMQAAAAATPVVQTAASHAVPAGGAVDEQALTQKVLHDVQQRIDLMFEYRLREALAPSLARLTEAVLRETRVELATTLRDVVARAVAQELSRHRQR